MVRPGGNVGAGEKWLDYGCNSNESMDLLMDWTKGVGKIQASGRLGLSHMGRAVIGN